MREHESGLWVGNEWVEILMGNVCLDTYNLLQLDQRCIELEDRDQDLAVPVE